MFKLRKDRPTWLIYPKARIYFLAFKPWTKTRSALCLSWKCCSCSNNSLLGQITTSKYILFFSTKNILQFLTGFAAQIWLIHLFFFLPLNHKWLEIQ